MGPAAGDDTGESHIHRGAPRDLIDVEWWALDGAFGGLVRVDVRADRTSTAFLAAIVGPDREPVVVIDHDLPRPTIGFELRASGIWTELICEVPLDHWTIGLEAFGLVVDPAEVVDPSTFGDRIAVGLDLDLDTVGEPRQIDGGFELGLRVHGDVLLGDEVLDLDGGGVRRRRWDGDEPSLTPLGDTPSLASIATGWPAPSPTSRRHLVVEAGEPHWAAGSSAGSSSGGVAGGDL